MSRQRIDYDDHQYRVYAQARAIGAGRGDLLMRDQ